MASVGAALAVVFTIAFATPVSAHAQYYSSNRNYNRVYSTPSYYVSNSGYNYNYGYSAPIVVTQPQVIYQQSQPIVYQTQPVYYETPTYTYSSYSPLTVSCYANPTSVSTGQSVSWQAYASGGTGTYSYTWTGTTGSYSAGSTGYSTYYSPGSYTASVTVYSNGQSVTQSCGYVSVVGSYSYDYTPTYAYNYPTTYTTVTSSDQNIGGNLVAACFADKTTAAIGTPVTWSVEVTGGTGQYTYSWSGSDGLAGTGASAVQSYSTTGLKDATVLINSNGQTISQACGDAVSIVSHVSPEQTNYQGPATNNASTQNASNTSNPNSLSAAAFLGLGNIPWGWIAILIIIILGVTVFYLLFNRHKV